MYSLRTRTKQQACSGSAAGQQQELDPTTPPKRPHCPNHVKDDALSWALAFGRLAAAQGCEVLDDNCVDITLAVPAAAESYKRKREACPTPAQLLHRPFPASSSASIRLRHTTALLAAHALSRQPTPATTTAACAPDTCFGFHASSPLSVNTEEWEWLDLGPEPELLSPCLLSEGSAEMLLQLDAYESACLDVALDSLAADADPHALWL